MRENKNCKHIYALLLRYSNDENIKNSISYLKAELNSLCLEMEDIVDETYNSDEYQEEIEYYRSLSENQINEDILLDAHDLLDSLNELYEEKADKLDSDSFYCKYDELDDEPEEYTEYESWNFEEEDLEEDDFYFEDDD